MCRSAILRLRVWLIFGILRADFDGGPVGPPAMIICEFGQARKGAAAADDSCAGMWLMGSPPLFYILLII